LGLPLFRKPPGCEKVIFLQGEFSSILTKCPSHLKVATFITLIIYIYILSVIDFLAHSSICSPIIFYD
jgi:hypothetical protein